MTRQEEERQKTLPIRLAKFGLDPRDLLTIMRIVEAYLHEKGFIEASRLVHRETEGYLHE